MSSSDAVNWRGKRGLILVVLVLALLAVVAWRFQLFGQLQALLKQVLKTIASLGFWGQILFVLLYIVCCVALVPGAVLTIGAGTAFGLVEGCILVSIGATLGATAAFLVGRYFARHWVERRMARYPQFVAIDQAVTDDGFRVVFLTRLCPLFPFFLMNYAYGLTRVSLRKYVLGTWLGIIPGSSLFVYIGWLLKTAGTSTSRTDWLKYSFILLTTLLALVYLTGFARRALAKKLPADKGAPAASGETSR